MCPQVTITLSLFASIQITHSLPSSAFPPVPPTEFVCGGALVEVLVDDVLLVAVVSGDFVREEGGKTSVFLTSTIENPFSARNSGNFPNPKAVNSEKYFVVNSLNFVYTNYHKFTFLSHRFQLKFPWPLSSSRLCE